MPELTLEQRVQLLEAKLSIAELQVLPALHNADVETATNATAHINAVQVDLAAAINTLASRVTALENA